MSERAMSERVMRERARHIDLRVARDAEELGEDPEVVAGLRDIDVAYVRTTTVSHRKTTAAFLKRAYFLKRDRERYLRPTWDIHWPPWTRDPTSTQWSGCPRSSSDLLVSQVSRELARRRSTDRFELARRRYVDRSTNLHNSLVWSMNLHNSLEYRSRRSGSLAPTVRAVLYAAVCAALDA